MKYSGHIFLLIIIFLSLLFSQNIFESYTTKKVYILKEQVKGSGNWDEYKGSNKLEYDASNLDRSIL